MSGKSYSLWLQFGSCNSGRMQTQIDFFSGSTKQTCSFRNHLMLHPSLGCCGIIWPFGTLPPPFTTASNAALKCVPSTLAPTSKTGWWRGQKVEFYRDSACVPTFPLTKRLVGGKNTPWLRGRDYALCARISMGTKI